MKTDVKVDKALWYAYGAIEGTALSEHHAARFSSAMNMRGIHRMSEIKRQWPSYRDQYLSEMDEL